MGQVYQLPRAQQSPVFGLSADALLAWEASTPDTIDFKRVYTQIAGGDVKAGLLLGQIVFRFKPALQGRASRWLVQRRKRLWFPQRRQDWQAECSLSPKEFDRASNVLVAHGLIAKKRFRCDRGFPTVHVSLNAETLWDRIAAVAAGPRNFPTRENPGTSPQGKILKKDFSKDPKPRDPLPYPAPSPDRRDVYDRKFWGFTHKG